MSTSDSVAVSQIPLNLLSNVRAKVLHYLSEAAEFSAEVQQIPGQSARLVISLGNKSSKHIFKILILVFFPSFCLL